MADSKTPTLEGGRLGGNRIPHPSQNLSGPLRQTGTKVLLPSHRTSGDRLLGALFALDCLFYALVHPHRKARP